MSYTMDLFRELTEKRKLTESQAAWLLDIVHAEEAATLQKKPIPADQIERIALILLSSVANGPKQGLEWTAEERAVYTFCKARHNLIDSGKTEEEAAQILEEMKLTRILDETFRA